MRIGILALQGAFAEHANLLRCLGAQPVELRQARDLEEPLDGVILPGGESTVMGKLLHDLGMFAPLRNMLENGLPAFGTCAGLLLLAKEVDGGVPQFALMDMEARRNAYGRQLGSFATQTTFRGIGKIPAVFIRAPYIARTWGQAQALAEVDGKIVAARQGNLLVTAFHPELTDDLSVHRYFLNMVQAAAAKRCPAV